MVLAADNRIETEEYSPRRFTLEEFYRMGKAGLFQDERVELVEGEIVCMSPIGPEHDAGVDLIAEAIRAAFVGAFRVRVQSTVQVARTSDLHPDIAVVVGRARDYSRAHPQTAVLVVEVAETSLQYDRRVKTALYARANVPEYWIVNLKERQLEVYLESEEIPDRPRGYGYRTSHVYKPGDIVSPLGAPSAIIKVEDLLP